MRFSSAWRRIRESGWEKFNRACGGCWAARAAEFSIGGKPWWIEFPEWIEFRGMDAARCRVAR